MSTINYFGEWVKRFLLEYLISIKNQSKNTQKSYRDTLKLLVGYIKNKNQYQIEKLLISDMDDKLIRNFLLYIEKKRQCSITTRNQRLAAIHAFAKFVGANNPEYIDWSRKIQNIPFKRGVKTLISYLNKSEMNAILNAANKKTEQGKKDYALLLFLYNTGARADEAAQTTIGDLNLAHARKRDLSTVLIKGKGNKLRRCPLWDKTVDCLDKLIENRAQTEHVFINRCKQPLTRFGIYALVKRYVKKIIIQYPSLEKRKISPHTIRHTTATHLLQSGVDINTIRAWLGHVSIDTTNIYTEVDLEMKAKALACCEIEKGRKNKKHWRDDKSLMSFLDSI